MKLNIDPNVEEILTMLNSAGFSAYLIGGSVRDLCLGRPVHDADVATNARPEETERVLKEKFPVIGDLGRRFGTVLVLMRNGAPCEITTFRAESDYTDNRHPDRVTFSETLEEDVIRRDFTVNALAYHPKTGILDFVNGMADLQNRILRTVGKPDERFSEDPLRIIRGIRFSAQLQMKIEEETHCAMFRKAHLLSTVSNERIGAELSKFLMTPEPHTLCHTNGEILAACVPELKPMLHFDQNNPHHCYDLWQHTVQVLAHTPPILPLRFAALFHDCGKPHCQSFDENGIAHYYGHAAKSAEIAKTVLSRLAVGKSISEEVCALIRHHDGVIEETDKAIRRKMAKLGADRTRNLLLLQKADHLAQAEAYRSRTVSDDRKLAILDEAVQRGDCISANKLAVNGHDLIARGYKGPAIKTALTELLNAVIDGTLPNEKEILLNYLNERSQTSC